MRADEAEQLAALYDAHAAPVWRYVVSLTGDRAGADDIVQETLLRAWRTPRIMADDPAALRSWMITVARNLVVDEARSARRRHENPVADIPDRATSDDTDALFDALLIEEALAGLSADHRAVIRPAELIERVEVVTYNLAAELNDTAPRNTLAAKFSVPFAVATRLVNGSSALASFTWEAVRDARVQALARKVSVAEDAAMTRRLPHERPSRVTITDRAGRPVVLATGGVTLLVSLLLCAWAPEGSSWQIFAGLFLLGLGWSFATVSSSTMIADHAPLEARTDVQGGADLVMGVTAAVAGGLAGLIVDQAGYPALALTTTALAVVVVLAAARSWRLAELPA